MRVYFQQWGLEIRPAAHNSDLSDSREYANSFQICGLHMVKDFVVNCQPKLCLPSTCFCMFSYKSLISELCARWGGPDSGTEYCCISVYSVFTTYGSTFITPIIFKSSTVGVGFGPASCSWTMFNRILRNVYLQHTLPQLKFEERLSWVYINRNKCGVNRLLKGKIAGDLVETNLHI